MNERVFSQIGKIFITCNQDCGEKEQSHYINMSYPYQVQPIGHNEGAICCVANGAPAQDGLTVSNCALAQVRVCLVKTKQRGLQFEYTPNKW